MATVPFTVLVVCTGNICRSPLAERLGQAHVATLLDDPDVLRLESAGTRAVVGSEMDPTSALVLRELGGASNGFTARQLTDHIAGAADLTLTMTREHRREVLSRAPRAMSRTFTLREAAGLLELLSADVDLPDGDPVERARALVKLMAGARPLRPGGLDDDIPDPINQLTAVHVAVGSTIAAALRPLLDRFAAVLGAPALLPTAPSDRTA